jgi:hypothetical protein
VAVTVTLGWQAMLVTLLLIAIELTFSFDNAIINARVLATMNAFWRQMFMTVGIVVAVFGMRIIFPVIIVMCTAGLGWNEVVSLALTNPKHYGEVLRLAHPAISAFGGMFLLILALEFFFDATRSIHWLARLERHLQYIGTKWLHVLMTIFVLLVVTACSVNHHARVIFIAGLAGIVVYLVIHGASEFVTTRRQEAERHVRGKLQRIALAGVLSFVYLEVLDASFSFDGVIGAFAITKDVVIIAAGLGIGALWVRSLTLFIVHRNVLQNYKYLEHGAHYVIVMLALTLIVGLFYDIPEAVAGIAGVAVIVAALVSSIKDNKLTART